MKIKGVEGLTPELIRAEVDRGARFVVYTYCISLFVVTLKRPSDVYLIPAGQSRLTKGLPFTLLSLVMGWWGFPWGPIYTVVALVKNFGGGDDVTDGVLNAIGVATPSAPPPLPLTGSMPEPTFTSAASRPPGRPSTFSRAQLIRGVSILAAVVVAIYAIVCFSLGQSVDAVVLSGLPAPYTVRVNGQEVAVPAHGQTKISLKVGEVTVAGLPGGGSETFQIDSPFFSRPFDRKVVVICPDRLAVFYQYDVVYKADNQRSDAGAPDEKPQIFVNQLAYVLPKPDYFFEPQPARIQMSKQGFETRSRITELPSMSAADVVHTIEHQVNSEAAKAYLSRWASVDPDNEEIGRLVAQHLGLASHLALLEPHLEERPVRVNVHRWYQNYTERLKPEVDLEKKYAAWAAAEPDNGALLYLQGRIEKDPTRARPLMEKALTVSHPCAHAHFALAYLDNSVARYDSALAHTTQAEAAGLALEHVKALKRDALFGLGRHDTLLADLQRERKAARQAVQVIGEELQCQVLQAPQRSVQAIVDAASRELKGEFTAEERENIKAYWASVAYYAQGQERAFAQEARKLKLPVYAFEAAISERDLDAALEALKTEPQSGPVAHLDLYLAAMQSGKATQAEQHWKAAVDAMAQWRGEYYLIARHLNGEAALTPEQICDLTMSRDDKAVLLTALGLRFPEQRERFHQMAARLNVTPDFPQLLVKSVLAMNASK